MEYNVCDHFVECWCNPSRVDKSGWETFASGHKPSEKLLIVRQKKHEKQPNFCWKISYSWECHTASKNQNFGRTTKIVTNNQFNS